MPVSPRSEFKTFEDETERVWRVEKVSFGQFEVVPKPTSLIETAKSCALRLGENFPGVTDHGRVWNRIWKFGHKTKGD